MYSIVKRLNGQFTCYGKLQDSTEIWDENNLKKAVKSLKKFAVFANGAKIKKCDIVYYEEEEVTTQQRVLTRKVDKFLK